MRTWLQGSIADVAWCILTNSLADSIRCGKMLSTSIQILCQAFIHMGFIFIRDKGFNESRSQSWHAACMMHVSSCDVIQCVFSGTPPFCRRNWLHGARSFQHTHKYTPGIPEHRNKRIENGFLSSTVGKLFEVCLRLCWLFSPNWNNSLQRGPFACSQAVTNPCFNSRNALPGQCRQHGLHWRHYGEIRRHILLRVNSSVGLHALSIQCEIISGYGALITSRVCTNNQRIWDHPKLQEAWQLTHRKQIIPLWSAGFHFRVRVYFDLPRSVCVCVYVFAFVYLCVSLCPCVVCVCAVCAMKWV